MASYDRQRLRLKQEPIDNWSTQEKLALATGVQKMGNQNWGPIVRHLKSFAEKNRPSDWFNPKFCALQYNDMFDKIEAPKRKRGERGEETTQDLIVKKYSTERMQELEQGMKEKFEKIVELNKILKKLKSSNYDEKYLRKLSLDIKQREQQKKDEEEKHQKWLSEREMKLSQISMKFRGAGGAPIRQSSSKINSLNSKEKSINDKLVNEIIEKESDNEILADNNNLLEDKTKNTNDKNDKSNDDFSIDQNQANIVVSPKTENNFEESSHSDKNQNEDNKPFIETVSNKTVEISADDDDVSKIETNNTMETTNVNSDSVSSSGCKDSIEIINNIETTSSTTIKIDITNDESTNETNETVFEESLIETKTEDNIRRISSSSDKLKEQKIIKEIKQDPSTNNDSSMMETSIENVTNNNNKENDENSIMKIDSDNNNDDKNSSKIKSQQKQNDKNVEDYSASNNNNVSNDRSNNSRRKRRRANTNNNHVIQTRSTRSTSAHSDLQSETIVKKEDETVKSSNKKRTSSTTNDESSNHQFVNYSEESNDSKSQFSETTTTNSSTIKAMNNDTTNENDIKWKKASSAIIRAIQNHRCAPLVLKPFENNDEYRDAIINDIDLNATKKRIEMGQIRNEQEFKRDLMLMFTNGIILNTEPNIIKSLVEFAKETLDLFETSSETIKIKTRDKYHNTTIEVVEKNSRRLTRGSIKHE